MRRVLSFALALVIGLTARPVLAVPMLSAYTDNFDRPDDLTALGSNWTQQFGNIGIISHQAVYYAGIVDVYAFWNANAVGNDQFSQAVVKGTPGSGGDTHDVMVRASGTDGGGTQSGYVCIWDSTSYAIGKIVNNTFTSLTSGSGGVSANDVIRAEVSGTGITCKVNSSTTGTTTDSDLSSGQPGFGTRFVLANAPTWDDWCGGDLGATCGGGAASFVPAIINTPIRCCDIFPRRLTEAR